MIEIIGKYNTAKVFTDSLENGVIGQIQALCNQAFTEESKIRIMPDVHVGKGCTIGTTITVSNKIVPNLVGVDIGCGMETVKILNKHVELQKLDKLIYEKIPSGSEIRKTNHAYSSQTSIEDLKCANKVNRGRAEKSVGTLGGGNHFIELGKDNQGDLYLVVHSGSRHLGVEVAKYYQEKGYKQINKKDTIHQEELIARYKAEGRDKEIQKALNHLKNLSCSQIPYELCYVEGEYFDNYIHDMKIVQEFAEINRKAMIREIVKGMKLDVVESFTTVHNYIDTDNMILRKGAVSAKEGEKLLIPINMRDGSLICTGKGNADWNFSAPHGAGRLFSRSKAKESFTVSEFKKQMENVYTTSVNKNTLDECPMAYKNLKDIVENIGETVDILTTIKPIYNFKAGAEDEKN